MNRVWIVREGDGTRVDAIVARAGGDARAIGDGRVFIGRRRAKAGDAVAVGDEVRIAAARDVTAHIDVLHHASGILAVDKPVGIATIPDEHDASSSLLHRAAHAVSVAPSALHATSRLDRNVSGVVVFTETDAARESLQNARISGQYFRRYVAIASKPPTPPAGEWNARIGRARDPKRRAVDGRNAALASTRYRVIAEASSAALLSIEPITGRTHQIRVHASHAGSPLLGDRDYGGPRMLTLPAGKVLSLGRIALHCAHVRVAGLIDVRAPIPDELRAWWAALGGDDHAWS